MTAWSEVETIHPNEEDPDKEKEKKEDEDKNEWEGT